LLKEGAHVRVYDPAAMPNARGILPSTDVVYANDPYETAAGCDALLILTEWKEFSDLDLNRIRLRLKHPVVIDGRNLYSTDRMTSAGLIYYSIGRAVGVRELTCAAVARHDDVEVQLPLPTSFRPAIAG
jgi:UDPglucose 6-dehydrogenase